jgi:hypothetical protein
MKRLFALLFIGGLLVAFSAVSAGGRPFSTTLTGTAEVTVGGVANQGDLDGSGTASLTLNQGQEAICFDIRVSGITLPAIGAHIHVGSSTTTGPIVVHLRAPNASGVSSGCVHVNAELVKAIRHNPDAYYVNVHTTDYPAGALRGQLSR